MWQAADNRPIRASALVTTILGSAVRAGNISAARFPLS